MLPASLEQHRQFQAWKQESTSALHCWRMAYNLPITDPRVQEATEEAILEDLVLRRLHHASVEEAMNPDEVAHRKATKDESFKHLLEREKHKPLDAGTQRALQKLGILKPDGSTRQKAIPSKKKGAEP